MDHYENAEGYYKPNLEHLMKKFNLQDHVELTAFRYEFEDLVRYSQEDTLLRKLLLLDDYLWGKRNDSGVWTHLHAACWHGFNDVVETMLKYREDPNSREPETGDSPLILVMKNDQVAVIEVLLKHGADPNLANKYGTTPLHMVCQKEEFNEDLAKRFFKGIDDRQQTVDVNAKDRFGNTPLHLALARGHRKAVALLLRRGANPNLANAEGSRPLHLICQGYGDLEMMDTFFAVTDYVCSLGRIDVRDNRQNTPLHLALRLANSKNNRMMVSKLLTRGANPNLTDAQGDTALHIVCKRQDDETALLKMLFSKELNTRRQALLVDATNEEDRTPLELAAAALCPNKVGVLLENGADASDFVFRCQDFVKGEDVDFNLDMMSRILSVFEHLENNGFTMTPSEMEPLVFEIAKRVKICGGVSLYDAASDNAKAARELRYEIFYEFVSSDDLWQLPKRHVESCYRRLCNILKRGLRCLAIEAVRNMAKRNNNLTIDDVNNILAQL
ncbi:unnamed protein product [Trichogramma brassicae]|uniref:Uncharacterized protein n=1 Tax=Trichogramma brassicae TaxID=86971 RepID=A0A6H5I4S8_9HYME|nr:unnamed protein product [Trichogramma brassicae]